MSDRAKLPAEEIVPAIATELARLGVTATFGYLLTPRDINGNPIDGGTGELVLTLPRSLGMRAELSSRSLVDRAVDLVARRFATGDAVFDDAVHVVTEPRDATTRLLGDPALRRAIVDLVTPARPMSIDGAKVTLRWPGLAQEPGPRAIRLLELLLAAP